MSVALSYLGTEYNTPDHAVGYGTSYDPATLLSSMVTSQQYFQEGTGDIDVIFVKGGDKFMIALYKSFVNQKLLQQFVFSVTNVGGQDRLRMISRTLATTFSLEGCLRACGLNVVVSDDFSGTMATINAQLAPYWIQIYKA